MSELGRLALSFAISTLVPIYLPGVASRWWLRLPAAALLFALTLGPASPSYEILIFAIVAATVSAFTSPDPKFAFPLCATFSLVAVGIEDANRAWDTGHDLVASEDVLAFTAGWSLTVFAGGAIVGWLTAPFNPEARSAARRSGTAPATDTGAATPEGQPGAGRLIGWLERSLVFAFVVAGQPEAAALVFAAKSVARFGSLDKRQFAEYYLIGSLASLLLAVAAAIATRAMMDMSPL